MSGTPLPASLSGITVQRLIEIDQALLYLVTGALDYAVIYEPLEQTGALTPETAKEALSAMLETYLNSEVEMTPVGATTIWFTDTPPERWLFCDGSGVLKAEYPELFALFGSKYGASVDFFGLPDMTGLVPYGATFAHPLDDVFGEETHTLTVAEIPAHNHTQRIGTAAGTNALAVGTTTQANSTVTRDNLNNTGGGGAHNNLQPSRGVNFIVYGGKAP